MCHEELCVIEVTYFAAFDKCPTNAWLVSKIGRLTVGMQYEPQCKFLIHQSPIAKMQFQFDNSTGAFGSGFQTLP